MRCSGIFDADMHMHSAYQKPVCEVLHILSEDILPVLVRVSLARPVRKGVCRCSINFPVVFFCHTRNGSPQCAQIRS